MKNCDIIIPVYNAFDYVKKCIESIIMNTDLTYHSLILIDDCSPDNKILPLLNSFKRDNPDLRIIVLENKTNMGFVKTVNKGMKYSENDVLLLNSDTEVSKNWLENIIKCAYSAPDVATVTALSNNATLASVPKGLQMNDLPSNMSFEEYSNLIEKCSYKEYPMLPTAHGFCMFIRRHALDVVGYFDEEHFGKGYGEENDFSFRCLEHGFKHLLCDNVIVYHKESQSFAGQKNDLRKENSKILKKMYPKWTYEIDRWCAKFPIQHICKNIDYNIGMFNRKNILFLIHDWSDLQNNVGGTTLHCKDLITGLRKIYNVHVLHPFDGSYKINSYFETDENEICFSFPYDSRGIAFYNSNYAKLLESIIKSLSISLVHVHHLLGHYFDVADVCKRLNIPLLFSMHDYYCLCPTINMLYHNQECCVGKASDCQKCLKEKVKSNVNFIPEWRYQWKNLFDKADCIITPSFSTKCILEQYYPNLNCLPIEHGIDIKKEKSNLQLNDVVNIGFVGVMVEHKGLSSVEYLVKNLSSDRIRFHLFGTTESKILKSSKNMTIHGKYKREKLPELLHKNHIHLVLNLSILPETYSYTLTETIASGIPVLSYNLGAVGERINKYGFGWTIEFKEGNEGLKNKILEIVSDPDEYNQIIQNLNQYDIKSIDKMKNEYSIIYSQFMNGLEIYPQYDLLKELIKNDQSNSVDQASEELNRILNSRKWRLISKIKTPNKIRNLLDRWEN